MKFALLLLTVLIEAGLCFEDTTIAQYLSSAQGFTFVSQIMAQANLTTFLSGNAPITVFAPNDLAFSKLGQAKLDEYLNSPILLEEIAEYHIVKEFLPMGLVYAPLNKTTYEGQALSLDRVNGQVIVNGLATVSSEIVTTNGIILVVDEVLSPPILPVAPSKSVFQLIIENDDFASLNLAIILSDMVSTLEGGQITFFAPDNAAFIPYFDILMDPEAPGAVQFYQTILKNHIVTGIRRENKFMNGELVYTLHNTSVPITVSNTGLHFGEAMVTAPEALATNGVMYRVDKLIIPADLIFPVSG